MTNAQLLRHLRRHPHRVEVARLLSACADQHRGLGWYPTLWSRELRGLEMEIGR